MTDLQDWRSRNILETECIVHHGEVAPTKQARCLRLRDVAVVSLVASDQTGFGASKGRPQAGPASQPFMEQGLTGLDVIRNCGKCARIGRILLKPVRKIEALRHSP